MYIPLNPTSTKSRQSMSFFAKSGENLRDLAQTLDPKFALKISNYYITADGGLTKRKGYTTLFSVVDTKKVVMVEKYTDDLIVFGYGTTVAVYRKSTNAVTNVKTNFVVSGQFTGVVYGDYFFIASTGDKIGRISQTLAYDAQTSNFTVGLKITGATSGATAIILQDSDAGAAGTLTLGSITGTFLDNEIITDTSTGSATVNGALTFTYTSISAAPIAKILYVFGNRLYAGNLSTDPASVQYSEVDSGSNPPFTTWNIGTVSTDGGLLSFRNAGDVTAIASLGANVIIFADDGKWAVTQSQIDVGGAIKKIDDTQLYRIDFGGARGAKVTPKGLFYANEGGLWQLISVGQPNIPFSDQESLSSVLLGTTYFDDIDLSNSDIAYDQRIKTVLLTCAKNSSTNNFVIAYNTDQKAFSEIRGWNVDCFLVDNATIYAGSSNSTDVYTLFDGYSDNGNDIWTEFYTELQSGNLETRKVLLGTYVQGIFSASTTLNIAYDIYDRNGNFIPDKLVQTWTASGNSTSYGWGATSFGGSWGGDSTSSVLVESFAGARDYIRNFQRIRIKITGHDQVTHQLNWVKLLIKNDIPIRRRNLTLQ